jgi:short-subunit dehydrogenase
MNRPLKRVLVFGATSAIAQAALRELVAHGSSVFCIARDRARLDALLADLRVRAGPSRVIDGETADLLETGLHERLFAAADSRLGEVDSVLIAHGVLPDQSRAAAEAADALAAMAINALSVVSLMTIAANQFEARGRGVLAVITSIAGDRGRAKNYVYGSAKSLVSTFLQGLRQRLAARGVRIIDFKPGFVRTPMTAQFPRTGRLWADPGPVGAAIAHAMERRNGEVYVPWFWYWIMLIVRHIPERIFLKLQF